MTHQQNYANDRLGIFSFERVVNFIKCWTNLHLRWIEPARIASAYFARYAAEKLPVWSVSAYNILTIIDLQIWIIEK